jgi:hypothetical protein
MTQPQENVLCNIWPKDNWATLINDERPDEVIELLSEVYDSIRIAPRATEGGIPSEKWQESYDTSISILKAVFRKTKTVEQAREVNGRFAQRLNLDYIEMHKLPLEQSYHYWTVSNKPLPATENDALVIPAIKEVIEPVMEAAVASMQESPVQTHEPIAVTVHIEAKQIAKAIATPEQPSPNKVMEKAYTSVSEDKCKAEFCFKHVVFSIPAASTNQQLLNEAYQALCDLADALQISRKWIGMTSLTLNIGGAQVPAGLDGISSLNYSGEGVFKPISHQWFNCFDARIAHNINEESSTQLTFISTAEESALEKVKSALMKAVSTGIRQIVCAIWVEDKYKSEFYQSTTGYMRWKKIEPGVLDAPQELIARAFSAYIEDLLKNINKSNLALTGDTNLLTGIPYPMNPERIRYHTLFDALFITLKPAIKFHQNLTSVETV